MNAKAGSSHILGSYLKSSSNNKAPSQGVKSNISKPPVGSIVTMQTSPQTTIRGDERNTVNVFTQQRLANQFGGGNTQKKNLGPSSMINVLNSQDKSRLKSSKA